MYVVALLLIVIFTFALYTSTHVTKAWLQPWFVLCVPFGTAALLHSLALSDIITQWPPVMTIAICAALAILFIFSLPRKKFSLTFPVISDDRFLEHSKTNFLKISAISLVCIAFNYIEFIIAGQIPIFTSDPEKSRFVIGSNGYLHVISVCSVYIFPILFMYLKFNYKQLPKLHALTILTLMALILVTTALWASRGLLFVIFVMTFVTSAALTSKKIKILKIIKVSALLLSILIGVKALRGYIEFGDAYLFSQQASSGSVYWMIAYLTLCLNFEIFAEYIRYFQAGNDHFYGLITISPIASLLPVEKLSELHFQNIHLGLYRETTLTSTFMGVAYADFGIAGVIIAAIVIALLYKTYFIHAFSNSSRFGLYCYSFLFVQALMLPYTNPIFQVHTLTFFLFAYALRFFLKAKL